MAITTKDVRVNGYPPLDVILAHFDALPLLVQAITRVAPSELNAWDLARNFERKPVLLHAVSKYAEEVLNPVEA